MHEQEKGRVLPFFYACGQGSGININRFFYHRDAAVLKKAFVYRHL